MDILERLERPRESLSPAERRVADAILADPGATLHSSTAELARRAGVSDPMVSRLCRRVDCRGFPDLKLQLAASLAGTASSLTAAVAPGDAAADYADKRITANVDALEHLRLELDQQSIEAAVALLRDAGRIELFGMGASAAIARDAEHSLFRLGTPTRATADSLKQRMIAAAAGEETVLLAISFTGRTHALVESAELAAQNGARIIAISEPGSPLSRLADVTLPSGSDLEDTTVYVPMSTRIVVLTVIDILVTGLGQSLGSAIEPQLKRIKKSLEKTKLED